MSSRSGNTRMTTLPRILPFGNCSLSTVAMNPPSSVVIPVIFSTAESNESTSNSISPERMTLRCVTAAGWA